MLYTPPVISNDIEEGITVPGQLLEHTGFAEHKQAILAKVRELCGWSRPSFPGSQPVSLSLRNLSEIARKSYVTCEKTDGVRYLLLLASGFAFLIDRKETVHLVQGTFPINHPALTDAWKTSAELPKLPELPKHQITLLDGELVTDNIKPSDQTSTGGPKVATRFLIYDAVAINRDASVKKHNLLRRLKQAMDEILRPRLAFCAKYPEEIEKEKRSGNFLDVYLKDFFEIWDISEIRNFQDKLPHESDGIIFTPVLIPYTPGTCKQLLKWKPPHLNTVDFAAEFLYYRDPNTGSQVPGAVKLNVGHMGMRAFRGTWLALQGDKLQEMYKREQGMHGCCDGQIWECYWQADAQTVVPQRIQEKEARRKIEQWNKNPKVLKIAQRPPPANSGAGKVSSTAKENTAEGSSRSLANSRDATIEAPSLSSILAREGGALALEAELLAGGANDDIVDELSSEDDDDDDDPATATAATATAAAGTASPATASPATASGAFARASSAAKASVTANANGIVDGGKTSPTATAPTKGGDKEQNQGMTDSIKNQYESCCPILCDRNGHNYYSLENAMWLEGGWVLQRPRTDKTTPNDERVVTKVKESIEDGITMDTLTSVIDQFKERGKQLISKDCIMPLEYLTTS